VTIHSDEIELYVDRVDDFLKPFQSFTTLVSLHFATATVSVVPLVIRWKSWCDKRQPINEKREKEDLG